MWRGWKIVRAIERLNEEEQYVWGTKIILGDAWDDENKIKKKKK